MPLSLHCKKFMNTQSRGVAVYFSQTSQHSSSDFSVHPHQGQSRWIIYKDESPWQALAHTPVLGRSLVIPSTWGTRSSVCILVCMWVCVNHWWLSRTGCPPSSKIYLWITAGGLKTKRLWTNLNVSFAWSVFLSSCQCEMQLPQQKMIFINLNLKFIWWNYDKYILLRTCS